jgi:hypothetical protein
MCHRSMQSTNRLHAHFRSHGKHFSLAALPYESPAINASLAGRRGHSTFLPGDPVQKHRSSGAKY